MTLTNTPISEEEDEETVCLLGNQESPLSRQSVIFTNPCPPSSETSRNISQGLSLGDAEKTFYSVCKGLSKDSVEDDIEAVNEFLKDIHIENDVSILSTSLPLTPSSYDECSMCGNEKPVRQSLVVDVHISADPEKGRICKHSLNRFTRCYSDSSHSASSSKKGKWLLGEDSNNDLQNADKIETFCDDIVDQGQRIHHCPPDDVLSNTSEHVPFYLRDELFRFKSNHFTESHSVSGIEIQNNTSEVQFYLFDEGSDNEEFNSINNGGITSKTCKLGTQTSNFSYFPREDCELDIGMSTSSSTASLPACRICQLPSMEPNNQLISPCRCLGSIRYVHNNCLLKWLEVSSKKRNGPAVCELCQYQYLRHKKFVISHWRFPECSLRDRILHCFFIMSVVLMISCASITIFCFKEDRDAYRSHNMGELTSTEMITLSCGILFFISFFLAMYVEVKAKNTIYQLICKFFYMNHEWSVEEYDRRRDAVSSTKSSVKINSFSC